MSQCLRSAIVVSLLGVSFCLPPHSARAETAPLAPGGSLTLPALGPVAQSDLAGDSVERSKLTSFTIRSHNGAIACQGRIENRVLHSPETGQLRLLYRIRDTRGAGLIRLMSVSGFAGVQVQVGWMSDAGSTVGPTRAVRSREPGNVIEFPFVGSPFPCRSHRGSNFVLIATPATSRDTGAGGVRLRTSDGYSAVVRTQR